MIDRKNMSYILALKEVVLNDHISVSNGNAILRGSCRYKPRQKISVRIVNSRLSQGKRKQAHDPTTNDATTRKKKETSRKQCDNEDPYLLNDTARSYFFAVQMVLG